MSFFDRAKAAAGELAAKADQAMANAGIAGPAAGGGGGEMDAALRDYGLISWREHHGQPVDATDKERVLEALRRMESAGQLQALRVGAPASSGSAGSSLFGGSAGPVAPPPPPGAAAAAASAPGAPGAAPPPPPAPPTSPPPPPASGGGTAPPPPPPSWA